jgi:hypothetical protein
MKLVRAVVTVAVSLVPAAALACPGSASACGSCSSGFGPYLAALGVGLLVGMGSVHLQGLFRRK